MKILLTLVLISIFSVIADEKTLHSDEFYPNIYEGGGRSNFRIMIYTNAPNDDECGTNTDPFFTVDDGRLGDSESRVKAMYSMALTAVSTGKEIFIKYERSGERCYVKEMSLKK